MRKDSQGNDSAESELEFLRRENLMLREHAANPHTIQKMKDELGPVSLWSAKALEFEIEKRVAARVSETVAPTNTELLLKAAEGFHAKIEQAIPIYATTPNVSETVPTHTYEDGLEDAAKIADQYPFGMTDCSKQIRALKNAAPQASQETANLAGALGPVGAAPGWGSDKPTEQFVRAPVLPTPNTTKGWPWIEGNFSVPARLIQECEVWIGTAAHAGIQTHYEDGKETPNRIELLKLADELRALLNQSPQRNAP